MRPSLEEDYRFLKRKLALIQAVPSDGPCPTAFPTFVSMMVDYLGIMEGGPRFLLEKIRTTSQSWVERLLDETIDLDFIPKTVIFMRKRKEKGRCQLVALFEQSVEREKNGLGFTAAIQPFPLVFIVSIGAVLKRRLTRGSLVL